MNKDVQTVGEGRIPSEGWLYILMLGPDVDTMRMVDQPSPNDHLYFHRAGSPDEPPISWTLFGKDEDHKEAYFVRGLWKFQEASPSPDGQDGS
jgi:hypothetical protein